MEMGQRDSQLTCDFIGHDVCLFKTGRSVVLDWGAATKIVMILT
jgi:hypothetical protein